MVRGPNHQWVLLISWNYLFLCVCVCTYISWTYLFRGVSFGKHLVFQFVLQCVFWRWVESVRCFNSSYGPIKHWFGSGWNCNGSRYSRWTVSSAFYILYCVNSGSFGLIFYRKPSFYFFAVFSRQWTKAVCWGIWTPYTSSVWWGCYSLNRLWFIWWFLRMKNF